MEIESLYKEEDLKERDSLIDKSLQAELDKHCAAINAATSEAELKNAQITEAYGWLRSLKFLSDESSKHDYKRLLGIINSVAIRRQLALVVLASGYDKKKSV